MMMMSTGERLAEYARLLNEDGVNSPKAEQFLDANREDDEFVELAKLSRQLKIELQPERGVLR